MDLNYFGGFKTPNLVRNAVAIQEELAADLVAKGKQQAANFTWEATAAETVRVYAQMANPS